jgi:hypothetical protein
MYRDVSRLRRFLQGAGLAENGVYNNRIGALY